MTITPDHVRALRDATGAGVMDAKRALTETGGDLARATDLLRAQGQQVVAKKAGRDSKDGVIEAYVHSNRKIGVLVEVRCETDFVARSDDFRVFVHEVALQVAATAPQYLRPEAVPAELVARERAVAAAQLQGKPAAVIERAVEGKLQKYFADVCLLKQPSVRDDSQTIEQLLTALVAKLGENIQITRFTRFALDG